MSDFLVKIILMLESNCSTFSFLPEIRFKVIKGKIEKFEKNK
jgi:hypothetical protein